jgi:uncharacterized protein YkwD
MHISITGLKPKGLIGFLLFWRYAIPSFRQAQTANGNLFSEVKNINGFQCTLTAWKDKDTMRGFMKSGMHLKAIKSFRKIAIGKTYGYESETIPSWKEAFELLERNGKGY